jgi:hypothetical protein
VFAGGGALLLAVAASRHPAIRGATRLPDPHHDEAPINEIAAQPRLEVT